MTTRSAAEKADIIWANVLEDTSPGGWYGPLELPGLFTGTCNTISQLLVHSNANMTIEY